MISLVSQAYTISPVISHNETARIKEKLWGKRRKSRENQPQKTHIITRALTNENIHEKHAVREK